MLADTHLAGDLGRLPEDLRAAMEAADVVLHAGDVTSAAAWAALQATGVVHGVLGNNDHQLVGALPEHVVLELAGVRVAMVHDSGARAGREARMARRFPDAQLVVFGHSHAPVDAVGLGGQRLFNPGSPTQRRLQPAPTFGRLRLASGRIDHHQIVVL